MNKQGLWYLLVANVLALGTAQANCEVFEHINYGGDRMSVLSGQNIPSVNTPISAPHYF